MAISYPRELPDYLLQESTFILNAGTASSSSARGRQVNVTQVQDSTWTAAFQTDALDQAKEQAWSAWWNSLRGGLRSFLAYDERRANPLAYPSASASTSIAAGWNGTATVSSIGSSGAIGMTSLPASYQARAGDRLGLEQTVSGRAYYGYFEILEDVNASAGGAATLVLAPFIPSVFTTAAVARVWRPKCQFLIDWRSLDKRGLRDATPMSFQAIQRL